MKFLVIGGAGFIGQVLKDQLIDHGHDVSIYDTFWFGKNIAKANLIEGDVRNHAKLEKAIKEHDLIVNLAAIVGDGACNEVVEEANEINTVCAVKIAELCKLHNKRLVFASTCFVYGFNEKEILTERSDPSSSNETYPASKIKAETEILKILSSTVILRFGTLFGYSPRMHYDLVANIFAARALNSEDLTVYGGDQWRPLLHVKDAAASIIHCVHNGLSGIYNVLHANYQITTIAEIIAAQTGSAIIIDSTKQDTRSYLVSNKLLKKTGFTTKHGILGLVDEIKATDSWRNYLNIKYNNAKFYAKFKSEGKI